MSKANRLLQKIPQYTRASRHARAVIEHGTPRKWANLARVELERRLQRVECKSRPYILFLDPCNVCDLRCPLCPTGLNSLGRPQTMLSFEHFKQYFDPHAPYLFEVILHNWGESMLNPDLFKMIRYATEHNVGTNLSSNLVNTTSDKIDKLLDSGLEYLIVSLDGTTPETYEKYRVRGDLDRVHDNLGEILRKRKELGRGPTIEWQFIVMKHNEHETEQAEKLAKEIGVDVMRFIPVGLPFEAENQAELAKEWFPVNVGGRNPASENKDEQTFGQDDRPGGCYYLYRSMVVNPDGGVAPCCIVYKESRDFAKLKPGEVDIADVWNNDHFRSARSLFSSTEVPEARETICDGCTIFAQHPRIQAAKRTAAQADDAQDASE